MQQNIGLLDRYIRFFSGLVIYGSGVGMRRGSPLAKGALLSIGAMKMAEGVTGWCPLLQAVGVNTLDNQQAGKGSGVYAGPQTDSKAKPSTSAMMNGNPQASGSSMYGASASADGTSEAGQTAGQQGQGAQRASHTAASGQSSPNTKHRKPKEEDLAEGLAALQ